MKTKPAAKKSAKRRAPGPVRGTFTVRDMNRQPQAVLSAARKLGSVVVCSRSVEQYTVQPRPNPGQNSATRDDFLDRLKSLHATMRESGYTGFTTEGWKTFSKMIDGE